MTYHVVLFIDGLALVPSTWLSDEKDVCFYPTGISNQQIQIAAKNKEKPDLDSKKIKWNIYDVERLFSSTGIHVNKYIKYFV